MRVPVCCVKKSKKHLTLLFGYDIISTLAIWQRVKYAGVAELADALASGASDRKVVWVQVPSPAPKTSRRNTACFFIVDTFIKLCGGIAPNLRFGGSGTCSADRER